MKIKTKITLFISFFLVMMVAAITFFSVRNIEKQGEQQLQAYQDEAIEEIKSHLKDLVNVAYETIDKNYQNLSNIDYLSKYYQKRLQNILDSGEAIIKRYQERVAKGELKLGEAQRRAKEEIKALRFDGGTGYIWINDTTEPFPKMVMHPTIPELDGQILDSPKYNNALGLRRNLFRAFLEVTRNSREGYVDYLWPKPTVQGLTEEVPKLSYVRRYDDWGWILGTGIYIDDSRVEIEQQIKQAIKSMRYANGTGYFWINDSTLPYPSMVMHPTIPELDGQVMDDPKYNNALGIDKNLFQAFAEITAAKGDGFIDYLWPKPTPQGLTERTGKISYVKLHQPTGWIIGTGVYLDRIDTAILNKKNQINEQIDDMIASNIKVSGVFIAMALIISFVFSNTITRPISRLTQMAELISKGKDLEGSIEGIDRSDEIGELAKSIDRLKTSIKIMMDRMNKQR